MHVPGGKGDWEHQQAISLHVRNELELIILNPTPPGSTGQRYMGCLVDALGFRQYVGRKS